MTKLNPKTTVLVIDDTAVIRSLLTEALQDRGYDVQNACDGLSGVAKAAELLALGAPFADAVLNKPFALDELWQALDSIGARLNTPKTT